MLLRLGWTLASGLAKPRQDLIGECRVALRVWPNDLDSNLHMNNSRYLLAMDLGRWDYGVRTGVIQQALRRRWFPVAGSVMLRFRKSLDPFQRFELRTRVVAWDEKWWWFEQRFEVDGRLHARRPRQGALPRTGGQRSHGDRARGDRPPRRGAARHAGGDPPLAAGRGDRRAERRREMSYERPQDPPRRK